MKEFSIYPWIVLVPLAFLFVNQLDARREAAMKLALIEAIPLAPVIQSLPPYKSPDTSYDNKTKWQESNDLIQEACMKATILVLKKDKKLQSKTIQAVYKDCLQNAKAFI